MRKSIRVKNPKTRGEILLNARLDKGISLMKLGELINNSESYLCRIENGHQFPTPETLFKIFKALDCDIEVAIDWLLEDIEINLNKAGYKIGSLIYTRKE